MIMVEVTKIWWDGERLMAEPVDSAIMYKDNEVAQPDSTCNNTLRAQGKAYTRTCKKCGKGPCVGEPVKPAQPVAWAHKHINATLAAFGPDEAISMTKETWSKLREAIKALAEQPAQQERPNFAEWASDYVRDNLHKLKPEQGQWDAIPDAFNEWWNADYDDTGNPYRKDSPAYWAWSGWKAASKQPAQQPVAESFMVSLYNRGYKDGHHDTVEGQYIDIFIADMGTYHSDVVSEWLKDVGYTAPPKRPWVGLTEQEHTELAIECGCLSADWVFYGAALERKIKEKNEI